MEEGLAGEDAVEIRIVALLLEVEGEVAVEIRVVTVLLVAQACHRLFVLRTCAS